MNYLPYLYILWYTVHIYVVICVISTNAALQMKARKGNINELQQTKRNKNPERVNLARCQI